MVDALKFAIEKHKGQVRKFTGEPYIMHPIQVSIIISEFKKSKNIVSLQRAALLHDVKEDCNVSDEELRDNNFDTLTISLVNEVTSNKELLQKYGKKHYLTYKCLTMSSYALTLKLSDRLHNLSDFDVADEKFKIKYTEETLFIIDIIERFRKLSNTQLNLIQAIKSKLNIQ